MQFNETTVKGKWTEIKGEMQKIWGKITNDELEQTKGDIKSIAGLVQQRYGDNKEIFEKKFSEIVNRFDEGKDKVVDATKDTIKKMN